MSSGPEVTRLVVAPHLDDAVLSCWSALTIQPPGRTAVLTVFAGAPDQGTPLTEWDRHTGAEDAHQRGLERQGEDRQALARCGVEAIHLDFVGGGYGSSQPDWRPILGAIEEVAQGFGEIWIPAGIGDHPDHLLVARLATKAAKDKKRVVYADLPYMFSVNWRKMLACGDGTPAADDWLTEQQWTSPLLDGTRPTVRRLSADQRLAKRLAVGCYPTQSPAFDDWIDDDERSACEVCWESVSYRDESQQPHWPLPSLSTLLAVKPSMPPSEPSQSRGRRGSAGSLIDRALVGHVDQPAPGDTLDPSHLVTTGWAYSPDHEIAQLEVWLNGQCLGRAILGKRRADVAQALGDPGAGSSGFEFRSHIPGLSLLAVDEGRVELVAIYRDGSREQLTAIDVRLQSAGSGDGSPPEPHEHSVQGRIDRPSRGDTLDPTHLEITGWAYSSERRLSTVEVWLNGQHLGRAGLGRPRPDVVQSLGQPDAELSGFEFRGQIPGPTPQSSAPRPGLVDLVVTLRGGGQELLTTLPVQIGTAASDQGADSGASPEPAAGSSPTRPARRGRLRRRAPKIRMLVSMWDLDHGGTQLRITELVTHLMRSGRFDVSLLTHLDGPLRRAIEASGAAVRIVPAPRLNDALWYETTIADWAERFGGEFDLVLGAGAPSFPAADMALRLGVPTVMRVGEAEPPSSVVGWVHGGLDRHVNDQVKQVYAHAGAVVSVSHQAVGVYREAGLDARYVVLTTGVDSQAAAAYRASTDRGECRQSLGVRSHERLLVCAGSMWPVKGQGVLISALAAIARSVPRLTIALVGDSGGPYSSAISRYVASAGIAAQVRIVPFCDDLRPWWRAADVVVCSSETEGLPSVVLEGMAFGLPVMACRVGDIPYFVEEGRNGWLCDPSDVGSMVAGLERVAAAAVDELAIMGSASRRAVAPYEKEANLIKWTELLEEVAAGTTPTALTTPSPPAAR